MDAEQSIFGPVPAAYEGGPVPSPSEALTGGIVEPPGETDPTADAGAGEERLAVRIGGLHLLCAPDAGREVLLPPPASRLPHTPAWLLGVANVRGALVPVVDLAIAFGLERAADRRAYLLISGQGDSTVGLLVDGLPVLQRIDASRRFQGIPPHPELLKGHVRGAIDHAGATWLDIELTGLFETLAAQIAAAG